MASTFSTLLAKIKADIIALTDGDGKKVFEQVGCFVYEPKGLKTPACAIQPLNDPDEDNGIGNLSRFTDYRFAISIGVKGGNDDAIISKVLDCRTAIKDFFGTKSGYKYEDVPGHQKTTVKNDEIGLEGKISGALLFSTGLEIICKVQE